MAHQSISFRKRDEVDEVYLFPIGVEKPTFNQQNSVLMIEDLNNGKVRFIAGNIPGTTGYIANYPEMLEKDEHWNKEHQLAQDRIQVALDQIGDLDPELSYHQSNQGYKYLSDIYVEVDEERREEVTLRLWQVLNDLKADYLHHLTNSNSDQIKKYPKLSDEVLAITSRVDWRSLLDSAGMDRLRIPAESRLPRFLEL